MVVGADTQDRSGYDHALAALRRGATGWARTSPEERIEILLEIKRRLAGVSEAWATTAARHKLIPEGSPLVGEEWISGPYATLACCNELIDTLQQMKDRRFLKSLPVRERKDGQLVVRVAPHSVWDHLLLSGVSAEVWMQPGVTRENLAEHTATAYATPAGEREGRVALVLGAGNIAAIGPMDCFHKLFTEHQVVLLKLNPVNDYLMPFLEDALEPLVRRDALRIVRGDGKAGAYLCEHPEVDEIHITGAERTHEAIVWGTGEEGARNRAAGTPKQHRPVSSELGAVCPTIVVPGPWSTADLRYQAERIVTQKLHNSGFNCVAMQTLILPEDWDLADALLEQIRQVIAEAPPRGLYYPGAEQRLAAFASTADDVTTVEGRDGRTCLVAHAAPGREGLEHQEVFGPAMTVVRVGGDSVIDYFGQAIAYANDNLFGTLGANVLIHPRTRGELGAAFEDHLANLHYGAIAVNAWTGLAFLMPQCTWGAFPGHTLEDVQSGIGVVHNTRMFDRPERTVVEAPFRPFPRTLASGGTTLLPKPPWFVTNQQGASLGRLLTEFQAKPGWTRIPAIFAHALRG